MSPLPHKPRLAAPVAISGLLLAISHSHGHLELVLPAVPLLLLVFSLLAGIYPGCETIVRLAERDRVATPKRAAAPSQRRPLPPRSQAVRGGLLIAFGLAQRPPPLAP